MDGIIISTYILPIVLALIMFNLGLSLSFKNFKNVFNEPKALLVGLFCQMILLPLIAFALAGLSNISPEFKIGLLLIAICPGGATSNLITYLLKGNVALSVSLTSVNSILILITIPFFLYLGVHAFANDGDLITLPFLNTVGKVFLMIILPVLIGMLIKDYRKKTAVAIEKILKYVSIGLLALVFTLAILLNKNGERSLLEYYAEILPLALLLNLVGMLIGLFVGKFFMFSKATLITLPIEVGIQNSTLAITLAIGASFLNNPLISVPATVYGMFTFFSALLFGYLVKKFVKK
ncbi:MAG: bile acid:sodium symporter family protein [Salinivirgaceae bacterium]|nr:bile acid:sodium symporter family protein [Salinivirgaceae bacterium]